MWLDAQASAQLDLELGVLRISPLLSWQPSTTTTARNWFSFRGQGTTGAEFESPTNMLYLMQGRHHAQLANVFVRFEQRFSRDKAHGLTASLRATTARYTYQRDEQAPFEVAFADVEVSTMEEGSQGLLDLQARVLSLDGVALGPVHLGGHVGLSQMTPWHTNGDTSAATSRTLDWRVRLGHDTHLLEDDAPLAGRRLGWDVSVGRFHRIDPTGFGVDLGVRADARVDARPHEDVRVWANAFTARGQRDLTSAPDEARGLEVWLGGAHVGGAWRLTENLTLTALGFAERSDRQDPSLGEVRGAETWRSGAQLGLELTLPGVRE